VSALLTIGEFSRVTHLSVKALRHYDEMGLLQPVEVDPSSGYRRYATRQIPSGHLIRRFRDLDMPLDDIKVVLEAPDVEARDRAIVTHLERMQGALEQTQATVASLKDLLDGKEASLPVEFREIPSTRAAVVRAAVEWDAAEQWLTAAFERLHARVEVVSGPDTALYSPGFFEAHLGEVVAFVPIADDAATRDGADVETIPGSYVAVTVHHGPFADIDQAYGALGTYVAERVIGADGPIREHYLGDDCTEVAWPVRHSPR
jgi:DNA-binding transcriptional MerR regulator